ERRHLGRGVEGQAAGVDTPAQLLGRQCHLVMNSCHAAGTPFLLPDGLAAPDGRLTYTRLGPRVTFPVLVSVPPVSAPARHQRPARSISSLRARRRVLRSRRSTRYVFHSCWWPRRS